MIAVLVANCLLLVAISAGNVWKSSSSKGLFNATFSDGTDSYRTAMKPSHALARVLAMATLFNATTAYYKHSSTGQDVVESRFGMHMLEDARSGSSSRYIS